MRRLLPILGPALAILIALLAIPAGPISAQAGERCFPETGQCISGPIRAYWERGGGLPVFGFPITAQAGETVEGTQLQVQWFERDRLEIQPDGRVTAGRLGAERMEQMGTPWQPGSNAPAGPGCATFAETGHQVCGALLSFWRANGGLERFGLPLTGAFATELEGRPFLVQYFERRRFELHPELGPNVVLLGLLGREVFTARQAPPPVAAPAPEPTPDPGPAIQPPEVLEQYRRKMPAGFWQTTWNGVQVTVAGAEYKKELGRYSRARPGYKYLAFTVEVVNTGFRTESGRDTFFMNSASFDLIDFDGNTHDIDSATYSLDNYFRGGTFYPGTRSSGMLVFEIPENSAPAQLIPGNERSLTIDFRVAPRR